MKVKNIGNKLIGFGSLDLFPGETKALPEEFENNETVKTYEELGFIEILKEEKKAEKPSKKTEKPSKKTEKSSKKDDESDKGEDASETKE